MFRCEFSGEISKAGEKPLYVTVETRHKEYENTFKEYDPSKRKKVTNIFVTEGTEIVKQIKVREKYKDKFNGED